MAYTVIKRKDLRDVRDKSVGGHSVPYSLTKVNSTVGIIYPPLTDSRHNVLLVSNIDCCRHFRWTS